MNAALTTLSQRRHLWLPMQDIGNILSAEGLRIEDAIFCGREGRCNIELYNGETNISNSWLVFHWLKGSVVSDYEVTAYIS